MSGNPVFCTPLTTPPDSHSLWGWPDFTQTCLARRKIFLTGDWPALSPEQQLHIQNEHHPTNWPLEGNLKEQEGERWRTSEDGSASTTDSRLQRPSYEHDRQPAQQPLNPVHIFIKTLYLCYLTILLHVTIHHACIYSTGNLIWLCISTLTR